jgi:hypothetical protein
MKILSETIALKKLRRFKDEFRSLIASQYEHKAKPCSTCETPGACCLDAHFVNVRISKLEAVAIRNTLESLDDEKRAWVYQRINSVIGQFGLEDSSNASPKTFACPLFEAGIGCLVHDISKPLPCINHACYENKDDLPPDDLLESTELTVEQLNRKVYGRSLPLLPLPVAIRNISF